LLWPAGRSTAAICLLLAPITSAQNPLPPPGPGTAEVERVIVTGSNIPSAEEIGPNPVDTYRPQDIERLGVCNATDLLTKLPQEAGSTLNQNGGDGSVLPNLRGLLPKETLVLIDGKRAAPTGFSRFGGGVDINLIPFPMIDHIDILKDGASAVYGADAVAGVFNIFLKHKFRGLEIGGSIGNTNLGASNDAREVEGWLIAGTGDDKTDIVVIADFYDRQAIYSRDRDITSNAQAIDWGGIDNRNPNQPGAVGQLLTNPQAPLGFRLLPKIAAPTPHSAPNAATSPQYTGSVRYPGGNFTLFNFAAFTPTIPSADRQSFYGSFIRDLCDKYLEVFADFKYTRSLFNAALAPVPFVPDPFHNAKGAPFAPDGISVPIQNPFNPFTVADATLPAGTVFAGVPVTTGVRYRGLEVGDRRSPTTFHDILLDIGLRGELGEFGDYFKTWNWEAGFRYSRNEEETQERNVVSQPGLREALLDTNPATAFNPFLNYRGVNRQTKAAIQRVYVTLHTTGQFEVPLGYLTISGDMFNLPAGPVSFAIGGGYIGARWREDPDSLNTTFNTIGSTDTEAATANEDAWRIFEEVRVPITSPTWNFPGFYSLEVNFAESEEWFSQNTSSTPTIPEGHSQFDAQRPKVSIRWQPLDPKWIGAAIFRGTYTEAFHVPTLPELSPAAVQSFPEVSDPKGLTPDRQVEEHIIGNPQLRPEVAYEYSAGIVYCPKWIKGLTLSADYWNIDLRSVSTLLGAQFILDHESQFPGLVTRAPNGAITLIIDPTFNLAGAKLEGVDYQAIYILDPTMFGGPDWGRLTFTINGTYLNTFDLTILPGTPAINLAGQFLPASFNFTGSLPRNRAYASVFYDGPAHTCLAGFDLGATVHWTGQYRDDMHLDRLTFHGFQRLFRRVREWTTLDLIASYTFNLPTPAAAEVPGFAKDGGKTVKMQDGKEKNILPVSTAEYSPCGWRAWLNGTKITVGMQNVTDEDPPFVAGAFENNYDESLADVKGRFWYLQLKKRF
jgi:iron complex outermembrane receptor protein